MGFSLKIIQITNKITSLDQVLQVLYCDSLLLLLYFVFQALLPQHEPLPLPVSCVPRVSLVQELLRISRIVQPSVMVHDASATHFQAFLLELALAGPLIHGADRENVRIVIEGRRFSALGPLIVKAMARPTDEFDPTRSKSLRIFFVDCARKRLMNHVGTFGCCCVTLETLHVRRW